MRPNFVSFFPSLSFSSSLDRRRGSRGCSFFPLRRFPRCCSARGREGRLSPNFFPREQSGIPRRRVPSPATPLPFFENSLPADTTSLYNRITCLLSSPSFSHPSAYKRYRGIRRHSGNSSCFHPQSLALFFCSFALRAMVPFTPFSFTGQPDPWEKHFFLSPSSNFPRSLPRLFFPVRK